MVTDEREMFRAQREEAEQRAGRLAMSLRSSEAECAALRDAVGVLEEGRRRLEAQNAALREDLRALETVEDERDGYLAALRDVGRVIGCDHPADGHARCVRAVVERLQAERDALLVACRQLTACAPPARMDTPNLVLAVVMAQRAVALCEGTG